MDFFNFNITIKAVGLTIVVLFLYFSPSHAQVLNKEITAEILMDKNSEFIKLTGTAENKTLADRSLQYEFSTITSDANGNSSKSAQSNRFVLAAGEKKLLSTTTINNNEDNKIIILLLVYDLDKKPVGQARLVLNDSTGNTNKKALVLPRDSIATYAARNEDMAAPQDGYIKNGLVIENSLTKAGRDFYSLFYSKYYLADIKTDQDITITETPGRGRITRIEVKVADELVWQFFANPSRDYLKEQANIAFNKSIAQLQNLERTRESITRY